MQNVETINEPTIEDLEIQIQEANAANDKAIEDRTKDTNKTTEEDSRTDKYSTETIKEMDEIEDTYFGDSFEGEEVEVIEE